MTQDFHYVPLNSWAIASLATGLLSALSIISSELWILGIPGVVCGVIAISQVRKYKQHGLACAAVGIASSIALGSFGTLWELAEFNSETLPGYRRLNFEKLTETVDKSSGANRETLDLLVGQKICLKGYVPVPDRSTRISGSFYLTVDGRVGDGPVDGIIQVQLRDDEELIWNDMPVAVSGTLAVIPGNGGSDKAVRFELINAVVRASRSNHLQATRRDSARRC